ncbi:DNA double-strand break repair nuclease NurA [Thermovibrio ammonificans]
MVRRGIKPLLVETVIKRKEKLLKALSFLDDSSKREIENIWNEFQIENRETPPPYTVAAVDGSRNSVLFAGYVVYAVGDTAALIVNVRKEESWESFSVDVDVLKPDEFSEARLRILMGILEFKELLKASKESNILLVDGSILGAILRPTVFNHELPQELKSLALELFSREEPELQEPICSKSLYGELASSPFITNSREYAATAGYLEYLEYLDTLRRLLESFPGDVVAVSKRSSSSLYRLSPSLSDVALLNAAQLPPGFSDPVDITLDQEKKFQFPDPFEEAFRGLSFITFFVKLKPGAPVLKVELLTGKRSVLLAEEKKEVCKKVLELLGYFEIDGYPWPLREVHELVKIKNGDVQELLNILKFQGITGREGLGE